jgi:hypothetical protein
MEALLLDGLANLPLETHRPISDLERWLFGWVITKSGSGSRSQAQACPKRKRVPSASVSQVQAPHSEDERLDQTIRV